MRAVRVHELVGPSAVRVDDIVSAAEEITATEDRIREAVAGGEPLLVVRERLRYHDLQTKQ